MFMRWKQNTGANATYQALRDALQHKIVQRQDLVEKFCYFKGNYLYNILLFPAVLSILGSGQRSLRVWPKGWDHFVLFWQEAEFTLSVPLTVPLQVLIKQGF